jgi:serine/threonine-protein kinase
MPIAKRGRETRKATAPGGDTMGELLAGAEELRKAGEELRRAGDEIQKEVHGDAPTGFYSIDSKPFGTVYANGTKLGTTPIYRVPLAPGRYEIRIVLEDGKERVFPIVIESGKEKSSGTQIW